MEPDVLTLDGEMTIDPDTGLPKLPENYAWRVFRSGEYFYVLLNYRVERSPGFWKKLFGAGPIVSWQDFHGSEFSQRMTKNKKKSILEAATIIYLRLLERADLDELVGIYPPKSIL